MKILGIYGKHGRWFTASIPLLAIHTQGRTKKDLIEMVIDAVELLVESPDFKAEASLFDENGIAVGAKKGESLLFAAALRQQRALTRKTVRDVARELGSGSPNSYGRYEAGNVKMSLDKFSQLLGAINGCEAVLTIAPKS